MEGPAAVDPRRPWRGGPRQWQQISHEADTRVEPETSIDPLKNLRGDALYEFLRESAEKNRRTNWEPPGLREKLRRETPALRGNDPHGEDGESAERPGPKLPRGLGRFQATQPDSAPTAPEPSRKGRPGTGDAGEVLELFGQGAPAEGFRPEWVEERREAFRSEWLEDQEPAPGADAPVDDGGSAPGEVETEALWLERLGAQDLQAWSTPAARREQRRREWAEPERIEPERTAPERTAPEPVEPEAAELESIAPEPGHFDRARQESESTVFDRARQESESAVFDRARQDSESAEFDRLRQDSELAVFDRLRQDSEPELFDQVRAPQEPVRPRQPERPGPGERAVDPALRERAPEGAEPAPADEDPGYRERQPAGPSTTGVDPRSADVAADADERSRPVAYEPTSEARDAPLEPYPAGSDAGRLEAPRPDIDRSHREPLPIDDRSVQGDAAAGFRETWPGDGALEPASEDLETFAGAPAWSVDVDVASPTAYASVITRRRRPRLLDDAWEAPSEAEEEVAPGLEDEDLEATVSDLELSPWGELPGLAEYAFLLDPGSPRGRYPKDRGAGAGKHPAGGKGAVAGQAADAAGAAALEPAVAGLAAGIGQAFDGRSESLEAQAAALKAAVSARIERELWGKRIRLEPRARLAGWAHRLGRIVEEDGRDYVLQVDGSPDRTPPIGALWRAALAGVGMAVAGGDGAWRPERTVAKHAEADEVAGVDVEQTVKQKKDPREADRTEDWEFESVLASVIDVDEPEPLSPEIRAALREVLEGELRLDVLERALPRATVAPCAPILEADPDAGLDALALTLDDIEQSIGEPVDGEAVDAGYDPLADALDEIEQSAIGPLDGEGEGGFDALGAALDEIEQGAVGSLDGEGEGGFDALAAALDEIEQGAGVPVVVEHGADILVGEENVQIQGQIEEIEVGEATDDDDTLSSILGEIEGNAYAVSTVPAGWEDRLAMSGEAIRVTDGELPPPPVADLPMAVAFPVADLPASVSFPPGADLSTADVPSAVVVPPAEAAWHATAIPPAAVPPAAVAPPGATGAPVSPDGAPLPWWTTAPPYVPGPAHVRAAAPTPVPASPSRSFQAAPPPVAETAWERYQRQGQGGPMDTDGGPPDWREISAMPPRIIDPPHGLVDPGIDPLDTRGDPYQRLYDFPEGIEMPPGDDLWTAPSLWPESWGPRPRPLPSSAAPRRVSDRRGSGRIVGLSGLVYFRLQGRIATGELGDLSAAGAMVRTRTPVQTGSLVPVAIELPGLVRPLRIMARVIYVRRTESPAGGEPARMGLMFDSMEGDDRQTLVEYLDRFGR